MYRSDNEATSLKFVYTAMHGIGAPFAKRAFECFHLPEFVPVQEQIQPDPEFPTVAFPNPEEGKGSLVSKCDDVDMRSILMIVFQSLAIRTADRANADLILANDPDADRLAIAEKVKYVFYTDDGCVDF